MGRVKKICKYCQIEIFVDVNMVMLKDSIWKSVCDDFIDDLCDCCIEKRLGRKITEEDFKGGSSIEEIIPCNWYWREEQKNKINKTKKTTKK